VEVGVKNLVLTHEAVLGGDRLLDLHDHLGLCEHLGVGINQHCAGCFVLAVGEAATNTRRTLDNHLMSARDVL
jgi:hypothetical protein